MRKNIMLSCMAGLILFGVNPSMAEKVVAKQSSQEATSLTVDGQIQSVDRNKGEVSVKLAAGGSLVVLVDRFTEIKKGSKNNMHISSLSAGKKITVRYSTSDGKAKVAKWILILPSNKDEKAKGALSAKKS